MKIPHARQSKYKCVFTAYISLFIYAVQGARPICDIPPADLLEPTALTCYFPDDFVESKSDFSVINWSRNVSVVKAIWEDGKHTFSLEDGFSMDGQRSKDRLTFKINQVSRNHTGTYACIPEGYKYQNVGTCTLYLKTELPSEPESIAAGERHSQGCGSPRDLYAVFFTAVIAVPLISVVIVVMVLYAYLKAQHRKRDEHSNVNSQVVKHDEENTLIEQSENIDDRNGGWHLFATFAKLLKLVSAWPAEKVGLPMDEK